MSLSHPQRRWRGVLVFLGIAYGLSWATQIGISVALRDSALGSNLGAGVLPVAALLMWPPAVGAYVVRRWLEDGNFDDAGLRWPPRSYVVAAWLGPVALTVLTLIVSLPLYPFDSSFSSIRELADRAGQQLPADPVLLVAAQLLFGVTLAIPINCLFTFGEEFGWRGYLLPRLIALLGPWPGLIAHGAIWGFWHAPLIYLTGYNYPSHNAIGVPLFVVSGILMGVLLGWLQLGSRSVVAPTIAHASINATAAAPLLLLRGADAAVAGVIFSPVGWLVLLAAIVLLWRTGALRRSLAAYTSPYPEDAVGGRVDDDPAAPHPIG